MNGFWCLKEKFHTVSIKLQSFRRKRWIKVITLIMLLYLPIICLQTVAHTNQNFRDFDFTYTLFSLLFSRIISSDRQCWKMFICVSSTNKFAKVKRHMFCFMIPVIDLITCNTIVLNHVIFWLWAFPYLLQMLKVFVSKSGLSTYKL